jgi:REP element-mobilizing transposase RayT
MVHGYHVILPHYGFWLPNDPRGSWSDLVYRWELVRFGKSTRHLEQRNLAQLSVEELAQREAARAALKNPPVQINGRQALAIATGFAQQAAKSGYSIWACAILPEHTHLVIARHRYKVEQMANLLKGAATRQLIEQDIHPMASFTKPGKRPPRMWAERRWKVYLDSDAAIENAIAYVLDNPVKDGKPRQNWNWLTPYNGLDIGCVSYLD